MPTQAAGPFDVKLTPEPLSTVGSPSGLDRMALEKHFHGPLDATGQGEMLAFRTQVQGSAGYVAMEKVSGSLHGRAGSFVLQHSSTLTRSAPEQSITVVPDSGTGALTGLSGRMVITNDDGRHSYSFTYSLPDAD